MNLERVDARAMNLRFWDMFFKERTPTEEELFEWFWRMKRLTGWRAVVQRLATYIVSGKWPERVYLH